MQCSGEEFVACPMDRHQVLRASHTAKLPVLQRPAWVQETITLLETARTLSNNQLFVVRWAAGVVYARLPGVFDKRADAIRELQWARANIDKAPHPGWLREVYFHLALAYHEDGKTDMAQKLLVQSGYTTFDKAINLTTPFAVQGDTGFLFTNPTLREVVPDRVFTLSGFDFAELYFVRSADKQHLIGIDAGTTRRSV